MTERRYQMTRLEAGDYLLPGNNGSTLWRLHKGQVPYVDEDGDIEYRPGWELFAWLHRLDSGGVGEGFTGDWEEWEFAESADSRAEAIKRALELEAEGSYWG